ncbi:MAG: hypothetical protein J7L55_03100 [Desulfurococcales archaeon]|nr:hypothetical protein [Desulfurococcales archaeon]
MGCLSCEDLLSTSALINRLQELCSEMKDIKECLKKVRSVTPPKHYEELLKQFMA